MALQVLNALYAVKVYDTGTLFGLLAPVVVAVVGLLGAAIGRARWKDAAESATALVSVRDKQLVDRALETAECKSEIASLHVAVEEKDAVISRELDRVKTLEAQQAAYGGPKVLEELLQHSHRVLENHRRILDQMKEDDSAIVIALDRHEDRAGERHTKTLQAFDRLAERQDKSLHAMEAIGSAIGAILKEGREK